MFFSFQYFVLQDTDSDNDGTKVLALTCAKFLLSQTRWQSGKIKVTSTIIVFQSIKDKSSKVCFSVSLIIELRKSGIFHVYSSSKKFCTMERLPCLEGLGFKWGRYVFQKQYYLKLTVCRVPEGRVACTMLPRIWLSPSKKKPTHCHRVN